MLHFFKRLIQNLWWLFLVSAGSYLFLGVCNWHYNIGEWNGFSRFLFAIIVLVLVIATWESMSNVVKNLKTKR